MVIYADILVALNWLIDYFLLLAAVRLLSLRPKRRRLVLGAAAGGFYSLVMLLPGWGGVLSLICSVAAAAVMVLLACGFHSSPLFAKTLLCFFTVSFSFSGLMYALWYFVAPNGMHWVSGAVYFNLSPILLIVLTVICYLILTLLQRFVGRRATQNRFVTVDVAVGSGKVFFRAMVDTGNTLRESLSGAPVIVAEYEAVSALIPEELHPVFHSGKLERITVATDVQWQKRFRPVPYSGVGSQSLLPAFFPDQIMLNKQKIAKVCIAVCRQRLSAGSYHALVPEELAEEAELQTTLQCKSRAKQYTEGKEHADVGLENDSVLVEAPLEQTNGTARTLLHKRLGNIAGAAFRRGGSGADAPHYRR